METIKTTKQTKLKFDKLQFAYKEKGMRKTQDEMIEMLINTNKEYNKLVIQYSKALNKINELEKESKKK